MILKETTLFTLAAVHLIIMAVALYLVFKKEKNIFSELFWVIFLVFFPIIGPFVYLLKAGVQSKRAIL